MNAYFNKESDFISNKRIIGAYFGEDVVVQSNLSKAIDTIVALLLTITAFFSRTVVRRVLKASALSLCLVLSLGIVGAMEHGTLSLGWGILLGAFLVGIEALCLIPRHS